MHRPEDPYAPKAGATVFGGRYRLGEGRWEGAVGVVREAFDTWKHDRRVVIKHPDPYQGPEVRAHKEQLLDIEAGALRQLDALPQVCAVLDQGRVGSGTGAFRYLVIEWAEGQPVAVMAQQAAATGRSLPIGTILQILSQLAHVLAAAHGRGLINNDVDVKHLFWSDSERLLRVIDWGNAKSRSAPDWGAYGFQDDLEQFADVMYSLLTGQSSLDLSVADAAFWEASLSDVLEVVRPDLTRIGILLSDGAGGYGDAGELSRDLDACLDALDDHLRDPLERVDELLASASPGSLAEAEGILRELAEIAPVDEGVLRRTAALERIRRERQESAAMQLAVAYVKAESWLDAMEVLSRTFGHEGDPESWPELLLAASRLADLQRATAGVEARKGSAAAAKAIAERRYEDALDAYLGIGGDWLDTTSEPVRSLLAITDRYVLRHEVRRVARALREAGDGVVRMAESGGNSRHAARSGTRRAGLHAALQAALSALDRAPTEDDWFGQRSNYVRLATALDTCCRGRALPEALVADAELALSRSRELIGHMDAAEQALQHMDLVAAAEAMARVPRIDPENGSALRHAEAVASLGPILERIETFEGWDPAEWPELEREVLDAVVTAFATVPGSTMTRRVMDLVSETVQATWERREEERLLEGIGLLDERQWSEARRWANAHARDHPRWVPARVVGRLAEVYIALFGMQGSPRMVLQRASAALRDLDALPCQDERLRTHKRRVETIAECFEYLFGPEEGDLVRAEVVIGRLPEDDGYRREILVAVRLTDDLREAVAGRHWEAAAAVAKDLQAGPVPVLSGSAARWSDALEQMAEGMVHWRSALYPEAQAAFESALRLVPSPERARPVLLAKAVEAEILRAREDLVEEQAAWLAGADIRGHAGDEAGAPLGGGEASDGGALRYAREVARSIGAGVAIISREIGQRGRAQGRQLFGRVREAIHEPAERLRDLRDLRTHGSRRRTRARREARAPGGREREPVRAERVRTEVPSLAHEARQIAREPIEAVGWALVGAVVVAVIAAVLLLLAARNGWAGVARSTGAPDDPRPAVARAVEMYDELTRAPQPAAGQSVHGWIRATCDSDRPGSGDASSEEGAG